MKASRRRSVRRRAETATTEQPNIAFIVHDNTGSSQEFGGYEDHH
jgi:hypothetical protein